MLRSPPLDRLARGRPSRAGSLNRVLFNGLLVIRLLSG
jgi:hypothetical protein